MSDKDEAKSTTKGVDTTDIDEVRGHLKDSPDQAKLSDEQLEEVTGAGSGLANWDVSRVTRLKDPKIAQWDVSRVTDLKSNT